MNSLDIMVTVSGIELDASQLPDELSCDVFRGGLRGDKLPSGRRLEQGYITIRVDSIESGVLAVRRVRDIFPAPLEAELTLNYAYENQCNLELTSAEIVALAAEGMAVLVSCWPVGADVP